MTRHSADFVSLIFGLAFVAFGLVLLSGDSGVLTLEWAAPLTAIALGVLLVVAARSGGETASEPAPALPAEPGPTAEAAPAADVEEPIEAAPPTETEES